MKSKGIKSCLMAAATTASIIFCTCSVFAKSTTQVQSEDAHHSLITGVTDYYNIVHHTYTYKNGYRMDRETKKDITNWTDYITFFRDTHIVYYWVTW